MSIRSKLREHWWKGASILIIAIIAFVLAAAVSRYLPDRLPPHESHLITIRADIQSLGIRDTVELDSLGILDSYYLVHWPVNDSMNTLTVPFQVREMADRIIKSMPENSRIELPKHQKRFAFVGEWDVERFHERIGPRTFTDPTTGSLTLEELDGERVLAPVIELDGSQLMDGERPIFLVLTFEVKKVR